MPTLYLILNNDIIMGMVKLQYLWVEDGCAVHIGLVDGELIERRVW